VVAIPTDQPRAKKMKRNNEKKPSRNENKSECG
jgi:hypothetical protein